MRRKFRLAAIMAASLFYAKSLGAAETQDAAPLSIQQDIEAADDAAYIFLVGCSGPEAAATERLRSRFFKIEKASKAELPAEASSGLKVAARSGSVILTRGEPGMCTVIAGRMNVEHFQKAILTELQTFEASDIGKLCPGDRSRRRQGEATLDTVSYIFNAKPPARAKLQFVVTTSDKVVTSGLQGMATVAPTDLACD